MRIPIKPSATPGAPERSESSPRSHDGGLQRRLWAESERLTGVIVPTQLSPS